jgi:hypothetical protein
MAAGFSRVREVRRHHAELLDMMRRLELAVALPSSHPNAHREVVDAVRSVRSAFADHRRATEGSAGLYAGLLDSAPRLSRAVDELIDDHASISAVAEELDTRAAAGRVGNEVDWLRQRAGDLLRDLARHRQRGADLVYEAYATDLGGET